MNSVHDMGGMHGLGAIQREQNEPVFHADWEARVYALTRVLRLGPKWNIHMSRYSMEQMEPARYLSSSYYERWLAGLEKRLLDSGVLSPEELADGKPRPGGKPVPKMTAEEVRASLGPWRAPHVEGDGPARFKPGDRVVARKINPKSHTRLPRYIRGRQGEVQRDLGVIEFPDTWVERQDPKYQHVYSVLCCPGAVGHRRLGQGRAVHRSLGRLPGSGLVAEPVFQEPWEAQAFAMATLLQQRGLFTPAEWTEALSREIAAAHEPDDGSDYYHHWLAALEKVVAAKGLIAEPELARRKAEWAEAAAATPHGQPIDLKR